MSTFLWFWTNYVIKCNTLTPVEKLHNRENRRKTNILTIDQKLFQTQGFRTLKIIENFEISKTLEFAKKQCFPRINSYPDLTPLCQIRTINPNHSTLAILGSSPGIFSKQKSHENYKKIQFRSKISKNHCRVSQPGRRDTSRFVRLGL